MTIHRLRRVAPILVACAGLAMASGAQAAITSATITGGTGTGSVVFLGPADFPISVGGNVFGTDNLYIINEQQNTPLTSNVSLALGGGTVTLLAGTDVNSYFFVFDPVDVDTTIRATITFDSAILGVARKPAQVTATNYLGAPGVTYLSPNGFALEPGLDFTTVTTTIDLDIRLKAGNPGDVFRVLTAGMPTAPVPEPTSWALMVAGLGALGAAMRRPRRAVQFA